MESFVSLIIEINPNHHIEYELINQPSAGGWIILINGSAVNFRQWDKFLSSGLANSNFKILRYNYANTGESKSDQQAWSLEGLREELFALMQKLKIESAHLYGWSKGTMVAQSFALKYPQKVISLSGFGWYNFCHERNPSLNAYFRRRLKNFESLKSIWSESLTPQNYNLLWKHVYQNIIWNKSSNQMSLFEKIIDYYLQKKLYKFFAPTSIKSIHDWFDYAATTMQDLVPYFKENLANLKMPILIQHAVADKTLPIEMARELHQIFENSKLIEYEQGISHISMALRTKDARVVVRDYLEFLEVSTMAYTNKVCVNLKPTKY